MAGLYREARRFVGSLRYSGRVLRAKQTLTSVESHLAAKATGYNSESRQLEAYSKLNATLVE